MVFERILVTQEQRFDEYIRCLRGLNIDYSTDRKAFNYLLRARSLMDLFPNQELVTHIYSVGKQIAENDHYLYQQMGIFEMSRPAGNLTAALELLRKAESISSRNLYIQHSIAECYVRMADMARTSLEQTKYFNEAAAICQRLKRKMVNDAHPTHTLVKIGVRRLKALLNSPDSDELPEEFEETIKVTEGMLSDGLLQFPGDPFLLTVESDLADVLNDSDRGLKSLERAFKTNARSTPLARRLVACYLRKGNDDEAKKALEQALTANSGDRKLHYMYAKMLLQKADSPADVILYHLQRSLRRAGGTSMPSSCWGGSTTSWDRLTNRGSSLTSCTTLRFHSRTAWPSCTRCLAGITVTSSESSRATYSCGVTVTVIGFSAIGTTAPRTIGRD